MFENKPAIDNHLGPYTEVSNQPDSLRASSLGPAGEAYRAGARQVTCIGTGG